MQTDTSHLKGGAKAKWGFKAFVPWIGGTDASGELTAEAGTQKALVTEFIVPDLSDPQSIAELLNSAGPKRFVVVENFHYLPLDVQKSLAFDLKTFHELSVRFIVLGIWREANLLHLHNPDLIDRASVIPVEPWTPEDFDEVIRKGCGELNISISKEICNEFKQNAYGNIGMLQEFLKVFCLLSGVTETQKEKTELGDPKNVQPTFDQKLHDHSGELLQILQMFSGTSRTDGTDPLVLPYYLVKVILTAPMEELEAGIDRRSLLEKIRSIHHREDKDTIRMSDI